MQKQLLAKHSRMPRQLPFKTRLSEEQLQQSHLTPRFFHQRQMQSHALARTKMAVRNPAETAKLVPLMQSDEAVANAIRETRMHCRKTEEALRRQVAVLKERCQKVEKAHTEDREKLIEIAERQSGTMELQQKKISSLQAQIQALQVDSYLHDSHVAALQSKDVLLEQERTRADQLNEQIKSQQDKIESLHSDLASANKRIGKLETDLKSAREIHVSMAQQMQASSGMFRGILAVAPPENNAQHDRNVIEEEFTAGHPPCEVNSGMSSTAILAPGPDAQKTDTEKTVQVQHGPTSTALMADRPVTSRGGNVVFSESEIRVDGNRGRQEHQRPNEKETAETINLGVSSLTKVHKILKEASGQPEVLRSGDVEDFDKIMQPSSASKPSAAKMLERGNKPPLDLKPSAGASVETAEPSAISKKTPLNVSTSLGADETDAESLSIMHGGDHVRTVYSVTFDKRPMGVQIGDEGVIMQVLSGSIAAKCGVLDGDQIVTIDGIPITHMFAHTSRPNARAVGSALNRAKRMNGSVTIRFKPSLVPTARA